MSSSAGEAAESATATDVAANLESVRGNIASACERAGRHPEDVRLVAVSKIQPISKLFEAWREAGHRCFGENYVQELLEKKAQFETEFSEDESKEARFHFIGPLQSNKAASLVDAFKDKIEQLTVETLASTKLANKLNKAVHDKCESDDAKLKVFVQVNTSGEDTKSGVNVRQKDEASDSAHYEELLALCRHVAKECPNLQLAGLMTIGAPGDITCFDQLVECRARVASDLDVPESSLECSMGMSNDYEIAIEKGATNVRVGSTIFGERHYPSK